MTARKKKPAPTAPTKTIFDELRELVGECVQAAIEDLWKGGGDPAEDRIIELEKELVFAKLESLITRLERDR